MLVLQAGSLFVLEGKLPLPRSVLVGDAGERRRQVGIVGGTSQRHDTPAKRKVGRTIRQLARLVFRRLERERHRVAERAGPAAAVGFQRPIDEGDLIVGQRRLVTGGRNGPSGAASVGSRAATMPAMVLPSDAQLAEIHQRRRRAQAGLVGRFEGCLR